MPDVTVTLGNNKISVDPTTVQASASRGERVHWKCSQGTFQITFKPGSNWPNPPAPRQVNGVWETDSGPFNRPNTTLSYAVSASGLPTLDPDIEIIP